MTSIGNPFIEKPEVGFFTNDLSSLNITLDIFEGLGSGPYSSQKINESIYSLKTLKDVLLFRKETTLYNLGFDTLINDFVSLVDQIPSSTDSLNSYLVNKKNNIKSNLRAIKNLGTNTLTKPVLDEILYFDYARNGETLLNEEVGRLGDALVILSEVSRELNRIESVLAINPGKNFFNERGELMITDNAAEGSTANDIPTTSGGSSHFFHNTPSFKLVEKKYIEGTLRSLNAIEVLKDSIIRLEQLSNQIPEQSDQGKSLAEIIGIAKDEYQLLTWNSSLDALWADRKGGNTNKGELYWQTNFSSPSNVPKNFARLYMNSEFRKSVADALSVVQSQNDIQKQILSKALFLYQEFIKSSAALLDMTFKCSKSVAQKISR